MGYLINRRTGLTGSQGIGYDYVLGGRGLYVQASSDILTARVKLANATVKGLNPVTEMVHLCHGPIPGGLFKQGVRWCQGDPATERFFAIRWDDDSREYRLVIPPQSGTGSSVRYTPQPGVVAEFHSHCRMPAFFSTVDNQDEQGFRIYGVVGKVDNAVPQVNLRLGIYGHHAPVGWADLFNGPVPAIQLLKEESHRDLLRKLGWPYDNL